MAWCTSDRIVLVGSPPDTLRGFWKVRSCRCDGRYGEKDPTLALPCGVPQEREHTPSTGTPGEGRGEGFYALLNSSRNTPM